MLASMDRGGQNLLAQHLVTVFSCIFKFLLEGLPVQTTVWFRKSENAEDSIFMKTRGKGMKEIQNCLSFMQILTFQKYWASLSLHSCKFFVPFSIMLFLVKPQVHPLLLLSLQKTVPLHYNGIERLVVKKKQKENLTLQFFRGIPLVIASEAKYTYK